MLGNGTAPIQFAQDSVAQNAVASASRFNCNADLVVHGKRMFANSHGELVCILCKALDPDVTSLAEQQHVEWIDERGKQRTHSFDLVVDSTMDGRVAYVVRPHERRTRAFVEQIARVKVFAISCGMVDDVRFLAQTDFDRATQYNAFLVHGCLEPEPVQDEAMRDVVRALRGPASLGELRDLAGGGAAFRAAIRLIASGHLEPLEVGRLTPATRVIKKEQVQ